jgi:23S rRNA U2552 (ribose-2'-O)-methylase RlmE/FtsJ
MPAGSIVLGIDLMPIKAIRNVKTIVSDITTAECRRMVTQELQGWKADVVLCDGAPNVGAAYAKDAYVQNELVSLSPYIHCIAQLISIHLEGLSCPQDCHGSPDPRGNILYQSISLR